MKVFVFAIAFSLGLAASTNVFAEDAKARLGVNASTQLDSVAQGISAQEREGISKAVAAFLAPKGFISIATIDRDSKALNLPARARGEAVNVAAAAKNAGKSYKVIARIAKNQNILVRVVESKGSYTVAE